MQLTELLFQKVRELGGQGNLPLKPGYVAVVSKARAVRRVLVAALYPAPEDQRELADGTGPARIGVGLVGTDGKPYRLLRELGGGRQLQRFDPAAKKFLPLTEDDLEIASFLRVEGQLPGPDTYARFFVLEPGELPSLRGGSGSLPGNVTINEEKVRQLKAELQQTKDFEDAQDKLYKIQQRLHELNELGVKLETAERDLAELEKQAARALFTPAQVRDLTQRAQRAAADQTRNLDSLRELSVQRQALEEEVPEEAEPFLKDPLFWGGFAGGVAIDLLAVSLKLPVLAFLGLVPFFLPLVAVLKWVDAFETAGQTTALAKRLKEREESVKKSFAEDQAPLRAALKTANVGTPEELVELFKSREEVAKQRDLAQARLDQVKQDPQLVEVTAERPKLIEEKQILEMTVSAQGFARTVAEIERDLKRELGLEVAPAAGKKTTASGSGDADAARAYGERAAELLACDPPSLWAQVAPRFGTYLTALTDKRIVSGRHDGTQLLVVAVDGRSGPYHTLPQPLRDQVYVALRLALLERVVAVKKMPVVIDDMFATFDPPKKVLVHKMLKGLSAQTQVLHRMTEQPPPGLFDHVVSAA